MLKPSPKAGTAGSCRNSMLSPLNFLLVSGHDVSSFVRECSCHDADVLSYTTGPKQQGLTNVHGTSRTASHYTPVLGILL